MELENGCTVLLECNGERVEAEYTTSHSASSYGNPVFVIGNDGYSELDLMINGYKIIGVKVNEC